MTVALTKRSVTSLPLPAGGQLDYFDTKLPGFGLQVKDPAEHSVCPCKTCRIRHGATTSP